MTKIKRRTATERVIWELGGGAAVAAACAIHRNTVRAWEKNNRIPAKWQPKLMALAQAHGIELKAEDLIG